MQGKPGDITLPQVLNGQERGDLQVSAVVAFILWVSPKWHLSVRCHFLSFFLQSCLPHISLQFLFLPIYLFSPSICWEASCTDIRFVLFPFPQVFEAPAKWSFDDNLYLNSLPQHINGARAGLPSSALLSYIRFLRFHVRKLRISEVNVYDFFPRWSVVFCWEMSKTLYMKPLDKGYEALDWSLQFSNIKSHWKWMG